MTQNPWAFDSSPVTPATDIANVTNQAQSNIQNLQGQMQTMNQGYPAYENPWGLGGPVQNQSAGSASAPGYQQQPLNQPADTNTSRGFNPWSLVGEANARSK